MPWSLSSPGVGEVGAYCSGSRPSRMSSARRSPTSWASRRPLSNAPCGAARHRRVAEEGEGLLEKQVGRSGRLLARALAVEGPREDGVAPRPVLTREFGGPLRDERGFPFAAEGDEGEDVGRGVSPRTDLRPSVGEELRFVFAPDEFGRGVFDDAGDVEAAFLAGARAKVDDVAVGEHGRKRAILDPDGDDLLREAARVFDFALHPFRRIGRGGDDDDKVSQFAIPSSIFGQNFSSGRMAPTSLKTSSKPAARRNDSISAT